MQPVIKKIVENQESKVKNIEILSNNNILYRVVFSWDICYNFMLHAIMLKDFHCDAHAMPKPSALKTTTGFVALATSFDFHL